MSPTNAARVLRNTGIQVAGRCVVLITGAASVAVLTRSLGVEGYGTFVTASLFLSFFVVLADWGMPLLLTRELAGTGEDDRHLFGTVLVGRLLLALPAAALAVATAHLFYSDRPQIVLAVAVLSATAFSTAATGTLSSWFQAKLEMQFPAVAEVVTRVITLATIVYLVQRGGGLLAVVLTVAACSFVQPTLLYAFVARRTPLRPTFGHQRFVRFLARSLPLGAAGVINALYFRADAVMLSLMRPVHEVGIYGAAYRLLELVLVFPAVFGASVLPMLTAKWRGREPIRSSLTSAYRFVLLGGFPVAIGGSIVAVPLLELIAGPDFAAAAAPLRILLFAGLFAYVNTVTGMTIIAIDRQRETLWLNLAGLVLNVALNVAFIPRFGYVAAAINTMISEAVVMCISLILLKQFIGFVLDLRWILRLTPSLLGMTTVLVVAAETHVVVRTLLGASAYVVLLGVSGVLTFRELRAMFAGRSSSDDLRA